MQPNAASFVRVTQELSSVRELWRGETSRLRERMLELNSAACVSNDRFSSLQRSSAQLENSLRSRIHELELHVARDACERAELGRELDRLQEIARFNSDQAAAMQSELALERRHREELEAEVCWVIRSAFLRYKQCTNAKFLPNFVAHCFV